MKPIETQKFKARKPREQKHDFKDGRGRVPARRHINGKGWIANTAVVEDSVYVGPNSEVFNNACVSGRVRLEGNARVHGSAVVSGEVIIKQHAQIYGQAVVHDLVMLHDFARITGRAHVTGRTRMFGNSLITDSAQVNGCTLTGLVEISGSALLIRSHITGSESVGQPYVRANAVVINSTIEGSVVVEGSAQLLGGSALTYRSRVGGDQVIVLTGSSIVADESRVFYPVEFREHAVIVRCRFMNYYAQAPNQPPPERLRLTTGMIMHNREFRSHAELASFIDAIRNQTRPGSPTVYGTANGQPVVPVVQARQANFLETNSRPRRVQRLQEAGV